jgi:phospholipid transport system substrate-binding protein
MHQRFRTLGLLVAVVAALAVFAPLSKAQAGPAGTYLESRHQEVKRILARPARNPRDEERKNTEVTRIISSLLDFEGVSRRALGSHWNEHSVAERQEFVSLLRTLVERSYQSQLQTTESYEVRYESESARGEVVVVATIARSRENRRAPEIAIEYHMRRHGETWIVEDIVTDGVSMVSNYQSQFDRIIRRDGWAGLIERMRNRAASDDET